MASINRSIRSISRPCIASALIVALVSLAATGVARAQQAFKTPEDAVSSLVAAVRADNVRNMIRILGSSGREIIISGDEVADETARAAFLIAYDLRHQIVKRDEATADLVVGANNWRMPIPIVARNGAWRFDTARGREEVLHRRIGRNELNAIQAALAYVDAQYDYAGLNPNKARIDSYAQRIISSPGRKDGLYWPAAANEPQSPLGRAFAAATIQGYRPGAGDMPAPYHGYHYKVLTAQGPNASGGAVNYVVNGNMIGGFALVAYPAEYGNSGVMTFVVNHAGTVFQKDLGANTSRTASRMTTFNPDHTWRRVADADLKAQ